jgi:hypothetical protein
MLALMLEELSFRRYGRARDRALLVVWAVLENIGYRQLTVWWRLRGVASFIRGKKAWGKMDRKGFKSADEDAASPSEVARPIVLAGVRRPALAQFGPALAPALPPASMRESVGTTSQAL